MAKKKMTRRSKKTCAVATKTINLGGKNYQVRVYKRKSGSYVANIVRRARKRC